MGSLNTLLVTAAKGKNYIYQGGSNLLGKHSSSTGCCSLRFKLSHMVPPRRDEGMRPKTCGVHSKQLEKESEMQLALQP